MARDATADSAAAARRRREWTTGLALAALTALGALLRLVGLDRQSLWNDELSSFVQYTMPTLPQVFFQGTPIPHVPGYWLLMHSWTRAFGDSEAALRLPSALLGIATVPAMFALGRRWYGRREGLIAAGLTAVAWMPVYYSQEARPYALLLLAVVLSTAWLFDVVTALRAGAAPTRAALLGSVVAASVTAYSHYFGVLMVGLQAVAAALLLHRRGRALATLAALYGAVLVACLPGLYRALQRAPSGPDWIGMPTLLSVWRLWCFYFNESTLVAGLALAIVMLALARALVRGGRISPRTLLLAGWLALPVVGIYGYSHLVASRFLDRALIIAAPPAYLLLARALTRLPGVAASAPALLALVLVHLIAVKQYYTVPVKEQFREAAAYLVAHDTTDAPAVVVACAHNPGYFDYYLARQGSPRRVARLVGTAEDLGAVQALAAAAQARDVWLLAGHKLPAPALVAAMAERMTLVDEQHFLRAAVWHFRPGRDGP